MRGYYGCKILRELHVNDVNRKSLLYGKRSSSVCFDAVGCREKTKAFGLGLGVGEDVLYGRLARCTIMMLQPVVRRWCSCGSWSVYFLCFSWKAGEYTSVRERSGSISYCVVEGCLIERDSWPVIYFAHAVAHRLCTLSWGVDEGRFVESRFQYISQPGVVTELCFAQLLCWWRPVRRKKSPVWYFTTRSCDWVAFLPSQPERYERYFLL